MSGISGVTGSSSQDMYVLLQQISRTQAATTTSAGSSSTSATGSTGSSGATSTLDSLREAIQEAVSKALQGLDKNASAKDVMDAVKSAVDGSMKAAGMEPPPPPSGPPPADGPDQSFASMLDRLLEENGFDPDEIKAELASTTSADSRASGSTSSTLTMLMYLPAEGGVDTSV